MEIICSLIHLSAQDIICWIVFAFPRNFFNLDFSGFHSKTTLFPTHLSWFLWLKMEVCRVGSIFTNGEFISNIWKNGIHNPSFSKFLSSLPCCKKSTKGLWTKIINFSVFFALGALSFLPYQQKLLTRELWFWIFIVYTHYSTNPDQLKKNMTLQEKSHRTAKPSDIIPTLMYYYNACLVTK